MPSSTIEVGAKGKNSRRCVHATRAVEDVEYALGNAAKAITRARNKPAPLSTVLGPRFKERDAPLQLRNDALVDVLAFVLATDKYKC